ncbi:hypothetical protein G8759_14860 [Spirosoma aureum]|uniref:Uncharacterized protein n=1 Tax=Spirosoma aureum TaxID=2692134 RepID=A0A6G9AN25_9BACT|nr:hypothetical protein [Spirosoma aureum]QIP13800.1 hypothetical protein G8759_14860 [Spirosoma aureum]
MKYFVILLGCLLISLTAWTQDTTRVKASSADSLLTELFDSASGTQPLLPDRMVFTQRAFWGQKGLLRLTGLAPLNAENRQKELKIRRTMLVSHQVMGFITLAGFVAQGILGSQLYNAKGADYTRLHDTHETVGTIINYTYGTTALLSLTAPPPLIGKRERGLNSIKIHKYLAILHIAGMITTNILARKIGQNPDLKPYHRAAAYTTFAAFTAAMVVMKF